MTMRSLAVVSMLLNFLMAGLLFRQSRGYVSAVEGGQRAAPLLGADFEGKPVIVDYSLAPMTILYVFSPSCRWCEMNQGSADRLAQSVRGRARFIAIALDRDGLFDWLQAHRPSHEVVTDAPRHLAPGVDVGSTPETIVISRNGTVERIWYGIYQGETLRSIEAYFGVTLPEAPAPRQ